jgi:hypothetical protein
MHDREETEEFEQHARLAQELRATLREPVALPEGMAARIVDAVLKSNPGGAPRSILHLAEEKTPLSEGRVVQARMNWRRAVAAVLLFGVLTGAGSGYLLSRKARDRQTQQARAQLALAMEITGSTLRDVRQQVQQQLGQATTEVSERAR